LLLRFYEPTSGSIQVNDGHNIDEIDIESYRQQIAFVSQEPVSRFVLDALEVREGKFVSGSLRHNHSRKYSIRQ
jgi:ABC-type transport system involved in Fe-S cluster assembly fused permease/ATPase subunit